MSDVVLGVGASHSTLMNTHWAEVDHLPRAHAFRDGLAEAAGIIAATRPDAVVIIGSNHFRGLWLDLLPAFTIGVGECVMSGESGTPGGPLPIDVGLARHVCRYLVEHEFDVAFSTKLQVDHGIAHAVQYLLPGLAVSVIPIVVNVFAPPLPTLARTERFGAAVGAAIAADGEAKQVVVIGSGGLSHALPFPRWEAPVSDDERFLVEAWASGRENWQEYDPRRREIIRAARPRVNEELDRELLSLVERGALGALATWPAEQLEAEGGNGVHEVRTWLAMAAAAGHAQGRTLAYSPMPEWLTGMAVAVLEHEARGGPGDR